MLVRFEFDTNDHNSVMDALSMITALLDCDCEDDDSGGQAYFTKYDHDTMTAEAKN